MKDKIIIGSRESRLAVIQAEMVQDYLQKMLPQKTIEILTMKTTGDKILNQALERAGGKGLFVKELDHALLEKRSDLSVHSLKDVPTELPEKLPLLAFSRREDPRDALILPEERLKSIFPGRSDVQASGEWCSFRSCIHRQSLKRSAETCRRG